MPANSFEVQGPTERVPAEPGEVCLRKEVKKFSGEWPQRISGVLIQHSGPTRLAYEVSLPIEPAPAAAAAAVDRPTSAAGFLAPPLWKMLLYAFIGGLILNVMPCVLPVIALKILGFVEPGQGRAAADVRKLGLIHALGVLVSFLVAGRSLSSASKPPGITPAGASSSATPISSSC